MYDTDIILWSEHQAELLRSGRYNELDLENVIEEILDLGKRERDRFMSSIELIIQHLLKWEYQPQKRSSSWEITIKRERNHLIKYVDKTPTLIKYWAEIEQMYRYARAQAANETGLLDWDFPDHCPYTKEQIEGDWFPL